MFKSPLLKDHVQTIGIQPSLSNNAIYEHKCLENINKLYKQAGKCDDQQQFKDILEADMVSTPEGFTDKGPISPMNPTPVKKPSARKSLCMFTNILYVNKKNTYLQVVAAKSKLKEIKYGNTPWALKKNRKVHSKISEEIRKFLYNWIVHYPQVVPSPIANDCLKVKIGGYAEPQLVPNFLLQVSVRELHTNLVSDTKDGGLK